DDIRKFKSMVTFKMIAEASPFSTELAKSSRLRGVNRKREMNQMDWGAIKGTYIGLGLDYSAIETLRAKVDQLVADRNDAAHYGVLPTSGILFLEQQVRDSAAVVENVLTDLSLRLLSFFQDGLHRR